jgi:ketosteroid isomerase-like protein
MTSPDHTLLLRRAYRGIGLGVGAEMLRLFGQGDGHASVWSVVDLVSGARGRARAVVAEDLFGSVPSHWEVTRVEATTVHAGHECVVVTGHIHCRPRGVRSFDLCHVPFAHVWTLRGDEAVRVLSYLDGIELQRG